MFQRVNWSTLKAFFSVLIRSSDTCGESAFLKQTERRLREELLPGFFSVVVELCPRDRDERSFSHTVGSLAAFSNRC